MITCDTFFKIMRESPDLQQIREIVDHYRACRNCRMQLRVLGKLAEELDPDIKEKTKSVVTETVNHYKAAYNAY